MQIYMTFHFLIDILQITIMCTLQIDNKSFKFANNS